MCVGEKGKQKKRVKAHMEECVRGHALAPNCVSELLGLLGW